MILLSYNSKKVELDCGTGAGGFKAGNTCAKGGGSSPDLLGKKLVEKIKKDNPKADVAKEAVRMGVNAVVKAVRGAKIAGQYGASKTADIVRWLGTDSGKQFLGAVGRTLKITGVGAIGALRGLRSDRFKILGTAIFAPQFVPIYAGASALKGFFRGAIEEYNSEGSGRQISNAIRSSIGRPEFESADKAINLQEDPKPEDVIDYLADVLAVSIKDYIEDKNQLEEVEFEDNCGTGSGGFKEGNTCAKGRESGGIFVSPSIKEDSSFKDAIKMISSSEHARSVSMAKDVVKDQGMEGDFKSAVGDWEDGAENAIKIEVKNAQDFDQIAYTAAKLGSLMKQKAVIAFQNKNDGQDSIYKISSPKGMDDMRKILSDNGIKFRTIFEDRGKSNVTIFDKGSELLSKVNSVLEVANATGQIIKGVGEFIGGDSRIQGEQAYRKVISDYETKFPTRTRHRFARGLWLHYNGGAYQLNCGTGSGGFKEGNTCAGGERSVFHGTLSKFVNKIKKEGIKANWGVMGLGVYASDKKSAENWAVTRWVQANPSKKGIDRAKVAVIEVSKDLFPEYGMGDYLSPKDISPKDILSIKIEKVSDLIDKQEQDRKSRFFEKKKNDYAYIAILLDNKEIEFSDNCGTGSGGFKEGNTCAKGGAGGATMTPSWAKENPEKASKETAKNTTLYHGTSATLLKSIKEKGLLPSKSGVWGGGKVYSTDSLDLAMEYGVLRATSGKQKIQGKTLIGIVSVLAEGFQSVADNIPTTKAQKMGKTGLAAVSKIFTKDGAVSPSSIRKFDIFDFDSIRKYVYENGPKPRPLATKELEDGNKYVYVPILIEIPEGQEDENFAYAIGGGGAPAGTIPTAVIQGQGKERKFSAYTKPKLRERIKNRILRGTKGGKAGQWSARKAQLVAQAYEKAGGGYTGKRTKAQAGLKKWTKEKWRTSDNSKSIQRGKPTKRYLPSRVWDKLTPAEKASANRSKAKGAKKGKQFVPNPPSVTKKFSYNNATEFYDPSQPRDESGRWSKAEGVISDILKKGWEKIGGPFYEKKFPEGRVTAELKPWFDSDELRISHIETDQQARGKGVGSKAMKDITDSADKIGAKISGGVKPTGSGGLNKGQLLKWYEKQGFVRKPYRADPSKKSDEIVREPKKKQTTFSYNGNRIDLNCGTGSGGFKEGNTCAKGGGGRGKEGKAKKEPSEKEKEKLLKEIDAEIERLSNEPKAKEAIKKMNALRLKVAQAEGISYQDAQATMWSLRDPSRYVQHKDIQKTYDNPTPEHKRWRDQIIASELNPNAKSDNPIAVILMGSPASGKTTTGRPFAQKILGGRETTNIDPDAIKAKSKGFEGWNAGAFHEESSIIAEKVILPMAIKDRHNVLLDITGKNSDKVAKMATTLKSLGYTIGLVHVDVDDKVALKRASSRFNKPNGRWVPYSYIKGSAEKAQNTWNKLTKSGIADIGYSIDGNAERVQGKEAPVKETYGRIFE